jgi:hypothetical protein
MNMFKGVDSPVVERRLPLGLSRVGAMLIVAYCSNIGILGVFG